jgi:hypothetical protein
VCTGSGIGLIASLEVFGEGKPGIRIKEAIVVEIVFELAIAGPEGVVGQLPGRNHAGDVLGWH